MFKDKHTSSGKPKNSKAKKADITYYSFELRMKANGSISEFIKFSGIARSTIHGWKKNEEGIPLYALRNLELFEIKKLMSSLY